MTGTCTHVKKNDLVRKSVNEEIYESSPTIKSVGVQIRTGLNRISIRLVLGLYRDIMFLSLVIVFVDNCQWIRVDLKPSLYMLGDSI